MDQSQIRRFVLFLVLSFGFILIWSSLFPRKPVPPAPRPAATAPARTTPAAASTPGAPARVGGAPAVPGRMVTVRSPLYEYRFSTTGAALNAATLLRFESYVQKGRKVQLVPRNVRDVLTHRVVVGRDTLDFRNVAFAPSAPSLELRAGDAPKQLRFVSTNTAGPRAEVTFTFRADDYLVDVAGRITGVGGGARLITELGTGLAPHDAPEQGNPGELAVAAWNQRRIQRVAIQNVKFADTIPGPLVWAGIKSRYFLLAVINGGNQRFSRIEMEGAPDVWYTLNGEQRRSSRARVRAVQPLAVDGAFRHQAYLGPQEHARLAAVGHELEEVNPYGYRWLRAVVRPIAAAVLWLMNLMHDSLGLTYGWVLIALGFIVRLATWPLNARAMRAQMKNMAIQPELQARTKEIQQKYAGDQQRMGQEMMAMYRELGVSPFSMMSGCLPLLIPMPVLITLFFVLQSAIELRGESFWWLPDLSLRDPLNILPLFLLVSMFALQWVSTKMSGMEQNPQMKFMMYTMPLMMSAFFFLMPSGLNLYYASTNVASLPQQILIAQERRRITEAQKAEKAAKEARLRPSGARAKARTKRKI
ncbi:MAG TPA: membrane protein insertase YidC [Longimicrobium sp.]|nr:membrane protein insertase YidC [Longimicrobium sp.]